MMTCAEGAINTVLRCHMKMVGVVNCAEGWLQKKLSQSLKDGRTVIPMTNIVAVFCMGVFFGILISIIIAVIFLNKCWDKWRS